MSVRGERGRGRGREGERGRARQRDRERMYLKQNLFRKRFSDILIKQNNGHEECKTN